MRIFVLPCAASLLAACAGATPGESVAYRVGWVHGCDSGLSDAGRTGMARSYYRNKARYKAEPDYRRGWNVAHGSCAEEEARRPLMGGDF